METLFFRTINERDRRRFLACKATEPMKVAVKRLAAILKVGKNTIYKGIRELIENISPDEGRIRRSAEMLVILCDGGGSNSSRHHIVKQDFMDLADRLGLKILVMHYPPYCSKFNPIEHRLFSQITRSWNGAPLTSVANACQRATQSFKFQTHYVPVTQLR